MSRLFISLFTLLRLCSGKATVDQAILDLENSNSSLLQYPTQFTQNIMPKMIHSHNDYWRDVPLLTALSYGVMSVEADVWLENGTLYIGHELGALTPSRTLDSLYIQPILSVLQGQNPNTVFTQGADISPPLGPWDTTGSTPLQLLIELVTDGPTTLPYVLEALEPLRQGGYLTTYANGTLTTSAVTVVGTGNTPLEQVVALDPRDFFYDAPLEAVTNTSLADFNPSLSPIASTDYMEFVGWNGIGTIPDDARANLTRLVNDAHSRGIKARFWDTPEWPIYAMKAIWSELQLAGSDWLNADDLETASSF